MNTALLGLLLCCTVLRRMKWVFDWQQIDFMQRLWGIKSVRVDLLTILCNQETVHFIFSRTASPQLHLKHGFWNSADIYVFTLKSSLGEICCLFVVWGWSNGDGPEMELDLKKAGCRNCIVTQNRMMNRSSSSLLCRLSDRLHTGYCCRTICPDCGCYQQDGVHLSVEDSAHMHDYNSEHERGVPDDKGNDVKLLCSYNRLLSEISSHFYLTIASCMLWHNLSRR